MDPLLVSIARCREIVSLSRTSIYGMIHRGDLQVVKIGRRTLITMASIERLIEANASREA